MMDIREKIIICEDNNMEDLRTRYPDGLHFVVGDTHGETETLKALMDTVAFAPEKDHVYFVGDYNEGGNVQSLLQYMAQYYEADYSRPGFHLIRGNHERELCPTYLLKNLPDVLVLRGKIMNYYIVHAGMTTLAFDLINADMAKNPQQRVFAYRIDTELVQYDAPLRQLIWSRRGLYSQKSHWHIWPSEENLAQNRACVIHGHSPYCYFKLGNYFSYGDRNLFWKNQHIFFSEDLQSFNIDANVKGREFHGENHRGLACVCLEGIEETAAQNQGHLTVEGIKQAPNFVFHTDLVRGCCETGGDLRAITEAVPEAKRITQDACGYLLIME